MSIASRGLVELPPPFEWPAARTRKKERIFGLVLMSTVLIPAAVLALAIARADEPWKREGLYVALLAFGMWPASIGFLLRLLLKSPNPGLVLTAVRGGEDPLVEVRPRNGVGSSLVIPFRTVAAAPRIYAIGTKRIVSGEVTAQTGAGGVMVARTGSRPNLELARWISDLFASKGEIPPFPGPDLVEEIAAAAAASPLDAPRGIEAFERNGRPVWRYRTVRDLGAGLIWPWIILLALWLVLMPMLGLATRLGMALWIGPVELILLYGALLAEPLIIEFEVRATMLIRRVKCLNLTLWIGVSEARHAGVDAVALPKSGLRVAPWTYGMASPLSDGPDAAGIVWLVAAIRSAAGVSLRGEAVRAASRAWPGAQSPS